MATLLFYLGLGVLLALEEAGAFLLPGDMALIAAGVHARADGRYSDLLLAWGISFVAMTVGASVLFYGVGRAPRLGRALPQRVRDLVARYGVTGVFLARILPGLRNATVFAAAGTRLPFRTFILGLVPAAMIWSAALLLVGWFGSPAVLAIFGAVHRSTFLKFISFGLFLAAAVFLLIRMHLTREPESER